MGRLPPKHYTGEFDAPASVELKPIAVVHSPHKERFGTPRQAVLEAKASERPSELATVELLPHVPAEALKDLERFSHLWLISWMHLNQGYNATVIPPRGPRIRRGVLGTRAPHRPNPIALSAVRLLAVTERTLSLERVDLLDGTMLLDIKPYVPYADCLPDANSGWLDEIQRE